MATDAEWHPLPQRVSFQQRWNSVQSISLYETDKYWVFDEHFLEHPSWHSKIPHNDVGMGSDANVRVCHVPNIVSPNVFAALVGLGDSGLCLYESRTLRAAVSYTFENGARWFERVQCLISVWGLSLLVFRTCFNHEGEVGQGATSLYQQMDEGVFDPTNKYGVVADWTIAKGVVDLCLEVAEIYGRMRTGELKGHLGASEVLAPLSPKPQTTNPKP